MIKIMLVEGQNVMRNGIRSLLNNESDFEVVAEAANAKDALQVLKGGALPDILLTAIDMPQMDGIELLKRVHAAYPAIKVIMLSMFEDERYIVESFKAGAMGYMLKSAGEFELIFAIRHVYLRNEPYLCNELGVNMLSKLLRSKGNESEINVNDIIISTQDVGILSLLSEGFTNQEIADKLFTSKRTIEGHRQVLIEKTGTRNTAALIRYALLNSVID